MIYVCKIIIVADLSCRRTRFGRGFEVKMELLEDALSSAQPQESEYLSLVHSRLLCTQRELKALKPGEIKYPYRCVL